MSRNFDSNPDWRAKISSMTMPLSIQNNDLLRHALEMTINGNRVPKELGAKLHREAPITGLSALADMIKRSRFGNYSFFNVNLHVNTTNVCTLACRFCAFRRGARHPDAYSLSPEQFVQRIEPYGDRIDEVHSVGGLHPEWTIDHYQRIFRASKKKFPHISIKSLTAVEIKHIASRSNLTINQTLSKLQEAGLDSLPGGGAEILVDKVRDRICRGKESSAEYLSIHEEAHKLGIPTNCTMLFGTIESIEDRMEHLEKIRKQQDRSGGFQCFVPYPFLKDNTRLPEANLATGTEVIRVISLSRIMLDNIPHVKAYRMNIGEKISAIAINSGADDIDGTVGNEEIMHVAGSTASVDYDCERLAKLIRSSGQEPIRRNSTYSSFSLILPTAEKSFHKLPIAQQ